MTGSDPYEAPRDETSATETLQSNSVEEELEKAITARKGALKGMVIFSVILAALRINSSGTMRMLDLIVLGTVILICVVQVILLSHRIPKLQSEIDQTVSE